MTCKPNCTHPRTRLHDGRETCTWSREWMHECEATHICNLPTLAERRRYLFKVHERRGEAAYVELRDLVSKIWQQSQSRPAGGGG